MAFGQVAGRGVAGFQVKPRKAVTAKKGIAPAPAPCSIWSPLRRLSTDLLAQNGVGTKVAHGEPRATIVPLPGPRLKAVADVANLLHASKSSEWSVPFFLGLDFPCSSTIVFFNKQLFCLFFLLNNGCLKRIAGKNGEATSRLLGKYDRIHV